jgi:hypothetical protein
VARRRGSSTPERDGSVHRVERLDLAPLPLDPLLLALEK